MFASPGTRLECGGDGFAECWVFALMVREDPLVVGRFSSVARRWVDGAVSGDKVGGAEAANGGGGDEAEAEADDSPPKRGGFE